MSNLMTNHFGNSSQTRLTAPRLPRRQSRRIRMPNSPPDLSEVLELVDDTRNTVNNLFTNPRHRRTRAIDFGNINVINTIIPFTNKEDNSTKDSELQCIVCCDNSRCMLLTPCNHMPCCIGCTETIISTNNQCPTCRKNIEDTIKVFI